MFSIIGFTDNEIFSHSDFVAAKKSTTIISWSLRILGHHNFMVTTILVILFLDSKISNSFLRPPISPTPFLRES